MTSLSRQSALVSMPGSRYTVSAMAIPAGIRALLAAGQQAHPDVRLDEPAIVAAVRARENGRFSADLYLAAAARLHDPAALRTLDGLLAEVAPALRGVVASHEIDELVQELRVRLIMDLDGKPAALDAYAGKGPLRAWLRVSLLRLGLDRRRRPQPTLLDESAWLAFSDGQDPLSALSGPVGVFASTALAAAIAELTSRDRVLLRQHLLDGLSVPDLAVLHGVHRVTAFRWIATIRQQLFASVRSELERQLAVGPETLEDVIREIKANAVPTVERLLRATPQPQ